MSWLTVKQIAEHLQLSEAKVYGLARSGEIPGKKIGSQWRFDVAEVDEWVRKQDPNTSATAPHSAQRGSR
jgi:excisionase family DNA binding protein